MGFFKTIAGMSNVDQPLKILIVDDDEDDYFITSDYIMSIPNKEFKVDWSYNYNDAISKLTTHLYDIYFVDEHRAVQRDGIDQTGSLTFAVKLVNCVAHTSTYAAHVRGE